MIRRRTYKTHPVKITQRTYQYIIDIRKVRRRYCIWRWKWRWNVWWYNP